MKKFQAIIFDMDGVLVESEEFYQERRRNFLKENGYELNDGIPMNELVGLTFRVIFKRFIKENAQQKVVSFEELERVYKQYKEAHPVPYQKVLQEGSKELLEQLTSAGYRLGLASSSNKTAIKRMLVECQLADYFEAVVSGEECAETKPDPEIYQMICKQMAVSPAECLAIEDSSAGIQSAKSAGLTVWALKDNKYQMDQTKADQIVPTLSQIFLELEKNKFL